LPLSGGKVLPGRNLFLPCLCLCVHAQPAAGPRVCASRTHTTRLPPLTLSLLSRWAVSAHCFEAQARVGASRTTTRAATCPAAACVT
jgi:hypothetical protein